MAITLVAGTKQTGNDSNQASPTPSIDTTGATLLVAFIAFYGGTASLSDSKSNTWTPLTQGTTTISGQIFYVVNPTVGSGHTFTSEGDNYSGLTVLAFSGVTISSPFDTENGSTANSTTVQPGAVTPAATGDLVVTGLAYDSAHTNAINGSFVTPPEQDAAHVTSPASVGAALTYLIAPSTSAVNPTWTHGDSTLLVTRIATFKAAAGGGNPQITFLRL